MKKNFSILFFLATALTSFAQINLDSSKHLTFKGVPINGTLIGFVSKMQKNGFVQKAIKDGAAVLEGDFATYKNCIVGVSSLKQKDLVSSIAVIFPRCDDWSSLSSNYFNLKELLTEKYNKPSDYVEEFQSYTPDDDGSKFTQVKLGACKYYTTYKTEKGTIILSIEHDGVLRCFVSLVYHDKINSETKKRDALDEL